MEFLIDFPLLRYKGGGAGVKGHTSQGEGFSPSTSERWHWSDRRLVKQASQESQEKGFVRNLISKLW